MPPEAITLWLIEDNVTFRRTIMRALDQEEGLKCLGGFSSCEEALAALAHQPPPRLVLLDVGLPGMSGLEGIARLRERAPGVVVIILTVFEDDEKIFRAICAGAAGYLLKTAPAEEIARAIRDARAGGAPLNGRIARRVLDMFARFAPGPGRDYGLTARETQILEAMVRGKTKKETAAQLDLSFHTVDTHLRNIYQKLEVNTRTRVR